MKVSSGATPTIDSAIPDIRCARNVYSKSHNHNRW